MDEYPELNPGEYEAGGFPEYGTAVDKGSGGGGNGKRYYVGDKWEFKFAQIAPIYASNSNLNEDYWKMLFQDSMNFVSHILRYMTD